MSGHIQEFFSDDHRRLDAILRESVAEPGRVSLERFGAFRAGILKHIAMEEKVLFPAARRARGGEPVPLAAKLRLDHGAIAALLVPTPTPTLVDWLVSVLVPHNRREEQAGGMYDTCDEVLGTAEAARLVEELRAFPAVSLNPYNDGPDVLRHAEAAVEQARRQWSGSDGEVG